MKVVSLREKLLAVVHRANAKRHGVPQGLQLCKIEGWLDRSDNYWDTKKRLILNAIRLSLDWYDCYKDCHHERAVWSVAWAVIIVHVQSHGEFEDCSMDSCTKEAGNRQQAHTAESAQRLSQPWTVCTRIFTININSRLRIHGFSGLLSLLLIIRRWAFT